MHPSHKAIHNHNTFTFTFIRHLGKTHNHRSRGDTPWRAQTNTPRPHTSTRVREFPGK